MKLLRAMGMSAVAVVVAIFTMGGSLEPTTADAQTGAITCGSVVRGDVDGNGVGDLLVRAWDPQAGTDFELVRYPTQDRQVIGATALDARVEPSVTLDAAALGDLDGDGCAEAVFGGQLWPTASDQWYGTQSRLYVVPGSPTGLHLDRTVRIDLDGDAINQIVVVPGTHQIAATTRRNTGGEARGTLHVLTLNSQFASVIHRVVRGQDLKVQGAEQFGYALAADGNTIAVGSPDELIDRTGVRGAVYLYSASTLRYTRIHQRSKGVYTRWLSRFGHSVDLLDGRLVIGAPNADVGNHNGAGRVYLLRWNETKRTYSVVRSFSQATKGVPGAARDNDALGSTVVIARGLTASSSYDVVAAAMYDQLDDLKTAGSLTVTNFDKGGYRLITQDSPGVPSTPKKQGMFGWTLAVRNDGLRTSAVLASASQLDHPDTDGWAVVQTSPGRLNTWNFLWPSTTGHTYQYGYSITG